MKRPEIRTTQGSLHSHVHCALFTSQDSEATQVPMVDEWIRKMGLFIPWNIIQPSKTRKFCNM
jgi:hypothetical protein